MIDIQDFRQEYEDALRESAAVDRNIKRPRNVAAALATIPLRIFLGPESRYFETTGVGVDRV